MALLFRLLVLKHIRQEGRHFDATLANEQEPRQQIELLLAEALRDLQAGRLSTPAGNNALERYRKVLAIDPSNKQAQDGLAAIADSYLGLDNQANNNVNNQATVNLPDTAGQELSTADR